MFFAQSTDHDNVDHIWSIFTYNGMELCSLYQLNWGASDETQTSDQLIEWHWCQLLIIFKKNLIGQPLFVPLINLSQGDCQ